METNSRSKGIRLWGCRQGRREAGEEGRGLSFSISRGGTDHRTDDFKPEVGDGERTCNIKKKKKNDQHSAFNLQSSLPRKLVKS